MDDALAVVNSSLRMCVDILLDYMDEVNAAGVTGIRRPMRRRSFCSLLSDYFYSRMEQVPEHGSRFEHREDKGSITLRPKTGWSSGSSRSTRDTCRGISRRPTPCSGTASCPPLAWSHCLDWNWDTTWTP